MMHGVVILYNPTETVYTNIQSYINSLTKLYIIDNSDIKNPDLIYSLKEIENIEYIELQQNKGVAYALNEASRLAIKNGAKWLLTMDQDSCATPNMLENMQKCLEEYKDEKIGIVSPIHLDTYNKTDAIEGVCNFVLTTMTSGNLLNLEVYQKAGDFYEDFFIDRVDIEYCLRIHILGYKVLKVHNAVLHHSVGYLTKKRFLTRFVYPSNHPPLRYYYMTRNSAKVIHLYYRKFPHYCFQEMKFLFGNIIKVILFEEKKLQKVQMILTGFKDFILNHFGKYQQ